MSEETDLISLTVNGVALTVPERTTVAAAVVIVETATRVTIAGESRGPLCGMGICFECRVTIDGHPHQRSCQILCKSAMQVVTGVKETSPSSGSLQKS